MRFRLAGRPRRGLRTLVTGLTVALLIAAESPAARAAGDTTPPTGSWSITSVDSVAQTVTLKLAFADPESGLDHVTVACDAGSPRDFPYAATLVVPLFGTDGVGCNPGYGYKYVGVQPWNGAGVLASMTFDSFELRPSIILETPRAAVTGRPFTFRPAYPADLVLSASTRCTWELRWGSTTALRDFRPDETYGGLVFAGPKSKGYCGAWTFTLPWVPVRQYAVTLEIFDEVANAVYSASIGGEGQPFVQATVGSTDRHISSSSLPIAYLLPDRYALIVGAPVTYRLYTLGGATTGTRSPWTAFLAGTARGFTKFGGTSFTFVPSTPGSWLVSWNRSGTANILGAYYDPPARYRDRSAPVTTTPTQQVAPLTQPLDARVRVRISWSGSDRGWGIARYQVQRSMNGGTWRSVGLPSSKTRAIVESLSPSATWRYRVRAIDKAGNVGSWRLGPTFKTVRFSESSAAVAYRGAWTIGADETAIGGRIRTSSAAGASATVTFSGRDVAWVAPRGPGLGKAEVWVDGVRKAVVDLGAAALTPRQVVFRAHWATRSTHRVRIRVLATAGRPTVAIDGFVVLQ